MIRPARPRCWWPGTPRPLQRPPTAQEGKKERVDSGPSLRGEDSGQSAGTAAELHDKVHVAQAPPQPTAPDGRCASVLCAADAATTLALCQHPAATVATAPATHTTTTSTPVCGRADSATTPPAVSMTAAASWVGATARRTCRTGSVARGRVSSHTPSPAVATAAHKQSTAAISMRHTIRAPDTVRRMGPSPERQASPGGRRLSRLSQKLRDNRLGPLGPQLARGLGQARRRG